MRRAQAESVPATAGAAGTKVTKVLRGLRTFSRRYVEICRDLSNSWVAWVLFLLYETFVVYIAAKLDRKLVEHSATAHGPDLKRVEHAAWLAGPGEHTQWIHTSLHSYGPEGRRLVAWIQVFDWLLVMTGYALCLGAVASLVGDAFQASSPMKNMALVVLAAYIFDACENAMMVLLLANWGPIFVPSATLRFLSLAHVTFVRLKWICFLLLGLVLFPTLLMLLLRGPIERRAKAW